MRVPPGDTGSSRSISPNFVLKREEMYRGRLEVDFRSSSIVPSVTCV